MVRLRMCLHLATALLLILAAIPAVTGGDEKADKAEYGLLPEMAGASEKAKADKAVKVTIENASGQDVVFVSWRHHGPQYHYSVRLKDKGKVTVSNFAAEWRINGVWNLKGESQAGWGQSYRFEKDTSVSIEKDKLTIK